MQSTTLTALPGKHLRPGTWCQTLWCHWCQWRRAHSWEEVWSVSSCSLEWWWRCSSQHWWPHGATWPRASKGGERNKTASKPRCQAQDRIYKKLQNCLVTEYWGIIIDNVGKTQMRRKSACCLQHLQRSHVSLTPLMPANRVATALKGYCIPANSGAHSCPHTLALFNTGLHSLNSKLNPPSGLLALTDMVNIVESVCQDPGRPALAEQETHSQNIVLRWKMRPGNTRDGHLGILLILSHDHK